MKRHSVWEAVWNKERKKRKSRSSKRSYSEKLSERKKEEKGMLCEKLSERNKNKNIYLNVKNGSREWRRKEAKSYERKKLHLTNRSREKKWIVNKKSNLNVLFRSLRTVRRNTRRKKQGISASLIKWLQRRPLSRTSFNWSLLAISRQNISGHYSINGC